MFYPWFIFNVSVHLYKGRATCLAIQFVYCTMVPSWGTQLVQAEASRYVPWKSCVSRHTFFQFLSEGGCVAQQQSCSWEGCLVIMTFFVISLK